MLEQRRRRWTSIKTALTHLGVLAGCSKICNSVGIYTQAAAMTPLINPQPPYYSIWIFTHLKLCLADAIHHFKWVKIIQIWQNAGQLF